MELNKREINKRNRLIAIFMGAKFVKRIGNTIFNEFHFPTPIKGSVSLEYDKWDDGYIVFDRLTQCTADELCYHCSFDWLMPVIEKINEFGYDTLFEHIAQVKSSCFTISKNNKNIVRVIDTAPMFEVMYESVVEFIKWYNENK